MNAYLYFAYACWGGAIFCAGIALGFYIGKHQK